MANPQPDKFTKISNEILEQLAKIRIPGEARQMLDVILRKTYGFNKKGDRISGSQFTELTGLHKIALYKARKKLLSMNLITVTQKGNGQILIYSFQKDYDKWRVLPKKVTITQKGNGVLPKKVTNCYPKGSTQKTKDTIQKKAGIGPVDTVDNSASRLSKISQTIKGYEDCIKKNPVRLVDRILESSMLEEIKIWAFVVQARGKRNPAGYLVKILTDPKYTVADSAYEQAKKEMRNYGRY